MSEVSADEFDVLLPGNSPDALRQWADLLRHKASALRAVSDAAAGLQPGSLDPRALAAVLSGAQSPGDAAPTVSPGDVESALRRAREVWDSAADPGDSAASQALAAECDRVAAELDVLAGSFTG